MASICLYFQVHQPIRLRRYTVFDASQDYFDHPRNRHILRRVAQECYLPVTKLLHRMIDQAGGDLRLAFSITGSLIEQCRKQEPEVIEAFQKLAETGCVEFLAETYHHSLAFIDSLDEFDEQVAMQMDLTEQLFGQSPRVFRNTELIYSNALAAHLAESEQFRGILTEGVDHLLAGRSANHVYQPPDDLPLALLLKNYRLSDDIAFRFGDRSWHEWPLTADKYARWVHDAVGSDEVCGIFIDFETFGEHQDANTGILQFLEALPRCLLAHGERFHTPSECIDLYEPVDVYDVPQFISWADAERDLSAWLGNAMQSSAMRELFKLERRVKASGDAALLRDWRILTGSDHFYYMCIKYFTDGAVHKYFNPYESPYDSYINFMNVLDSLRNRLG